MSAESTYARTWPVGRYTCTLSLPADAAGALSPSIEWTPTVPARMTAAELDAYRQGRNAALRAWAAATGRCVALVDL